MQPLAGSDPFTGLSVDSAQFRRRAPVKQLSNDPDIATKQTVQEMCSQIHQAAQDPLVRALSFHAVRSIRGGPMWVGTGLQPFEHPRIMAESCWWWCKHNLKFKHHSGMFEVWSSDLGDPRSKLQLLISPDVLVRMRRMEGDCAIYTMMVAAMLEVLGLHWEICTGAVDGSQPDIFSHVWPRVVLQDGLEPLDASHGKYPGWQVPNRDIYRLKVWNEQGGEVSNQYRSFAGLHAYRSRRGFGDLVCLDPSDTSSCYQSDSTSPADTVWTNPYGTGAPTVSGPVSQLPPTAQITVPPQNTAAYAALAAQLIKGGFTQLELNNLQPGTVINPNGQVIRQNPGYAVTAGNFASGSGVNIQSPFGTASFGTYLPWILGLGVLAFAFSGGRR